MPTGGEARWRRALPLGIVAALGLALQLSTVRGWRGAAIDGLQYHALARELAAHHRFAFAPDRPPTYSRLPGYPLVLAVADGGEALDLGDHLLRATFANALFDLIAALAAVGIARRLGAGRRASVAVCAAVMAWPILVVLAAHALSESLATCLATVELWAALSLPSLRSRRAALGLAVVVGVAAGYGQLVRADAITLLPSVALAILLGGPAAGEGAWASSRRRRVAALGVAAAVALVVFAPWPLRNLATFGHPYATSWQWRTLDGEPLPLAPLRWARTWATGAPAEVDVDAVFASRGATRGLPAFAPRTKPEPTVILAEMADDAQERRRLEALFHRYDAQGMVEVMDDLDALARERAARAPLRTFVVLPLRRALAIWRSAGNDELAVRAPLLGLPRLRPYCVFLDEALYVLALGRAIVAWRRGRRALAGAIVAAVVVRSLLVGYLVALGVSQRMAVELFPSLIALAAVAATAIGSRARGLLRADRAGGSA